MMNTPTIQAAAPAGKSPAQARHDKLMRSAEQWVAQTFFGAVLKEMRNSPFKSKLFSGGRGGEAFTALYDQRLAEHMAHSAGRSLAASIVKQIERSAPGGARSGVAGERAPHAGRLNAGGLSGGAAIERRNG